MSVSRSSVPLEAIQLFQPAPKLFWLIWLQRPNSIPFKPFFFFFAVKTFDSY